MELSPTNTRAWTTYNAWQSVPFIRTHMLSVSEPADHWTAVVTLVLLPYQRGIFLPLGSLTAVPGPETYFVYGCELSIMTETVELLYRRNPSTLSDSRSVTVEVPRSSSSTEAENQSSGLLSSGSLEEMSSGSTTQSGSDDQSTATTSNSDSSRPSLGGGAIAGIAIGGILVLVLIVGGWFFWRRKQLARAMSTSSGDDEQVQCQEMPGSDQVPAQELDPAHFSQYAMTGASHSMSKREHDYELAYELSPESQPTELPNDQYRYASPVRGQNPEAAPEMTESTTTAMSANVEAQRRREMEWLEMEEERIRKRRETLSLQGGGKT